MPRSDQGAHAASKEKGTPVQPALPLAQINEVPYAFSPERAGNQPSQRILVRGELPDRGQIYLRDNALLERPLTRDDIKPRLLGHWGTTAGLNFIYTHLNRLIRLHDLNMMYVIGPGHGGPGIAAHTLS